ncbi:hypothetical protein CONLIGDRAFT_156775 [Coniochaeta ligniaria NRRL 30616]|uniref:Uncharacterized protein n=1 Tax=Coniochaeta ligniaria NRRL 30616 TaxID=1408157 RepID=A0A1J7JHV2_9PEZI|nr:hypothetical protein CONLIGDRAFT_156775 [Coniochaeta ligniaria NRRL 30616]
MRLSGPFHEALCIFMNSAHCGLSSKGSRKARTAGFGGVGTVSSGLDYSCVCLARRRARGEKSDGLRRVANSNGGQLTGTIQEAPPTHHSWHHLQRPSGATIALSSAAAGPALRSAADTSDPGPSSETARHSTLTLRWRRPGMRARNELAAPPLTSSITGQFLCRPRYYTRSQCDREVAHTTGQVHRS